VNPEIRIKNAWLLRNAASVPLNELWGDGTPLRSHDEYQAIVEAYITAWQPYEQKILTGMRELFGLEFHQNVIDVYIAPWFYAFSDPMVLGVKFSDSEFIETLTHELLHRLLTDNTSVRKDDLSLLDGWKAIVGDNHAKNTMIHIPVHAGLKAMYLDVLREPAHLASDIARCEKNEPYKKAWEYVEANDYIDIVRRLHEYYNGR
jgi:hypothetical protein